MARVNPRASLHCRLGRAAVRLTKTCSLKGPWCKQGTYSVSKTEGTRFESWGACREGHCKGRRPRLVVAFLQRIGAAGSVLGS